MHAGLATQDADVDMKPTLTPREDQLLDLVSEGLTNAEIAERLHVREQTVKNALSILFQKCYVRNRTELARTAVEVRNVQRSRGREEA